MITISKYHRHWAVYIGNALLAVVVYKKGALAIKSALEQHLPHPS